MGRSIRRQCSPCATIQTEHPFKHRDVAFDLGTIVMVIDGAGWHRSQKIELAENLRTVFLTPYAPELNPQEHGWDELREKFFHNRAFDTLDALETHLEAALKSFELSPKLIQSITGWDWIISSVSN